jgi:hypothetical protein
MVQVDTNIIQGHGGSADVSKASLAAHCQTLGNAMLLCTNVLNKASSTVREIPWAHSVSFFTQWLGCATAYHEGAKRKLLKELLSELAKVRVEVDQKCPRWGDFISETTLALPSAILQMVDSSNIQKLPKAVVALHSAIAAATQSVITMGIDDGTGKPACAQDFEMCTQTLVFGEKTVNVAAAIRIISRNQTAYQQGDNAKAASLKSLPGIPGSVLLGLARVADCKPSTSQEELDAAASSKKRKSASAKQATSKSARQSA